MYKAGDIVYHDELYFCDNEKDQKEKLKEIEDQIEKALYEKQKVIRKIEELEKYKYLLTE